MRDLLRRGLRAVRTRLTGPLVEPFASLSYAQEGEDRVLCRLFEQRLSRPGFYVDVGAHHPVRFSNTYLFYKLGWRGLNLDAMPGSMAEFRRLRPRDINLETAIAEREGVLVYHQFVEPALNTFSAELAESYRKLPHVQYSGKVEIACRPLASVLAEQLPAGTTIDFLTIDVEGLDLEVLRSNDWSRFRPGLVLVEVLDLPDLSALAEADSIRYLAEQGYAPIAKTANTVFLRDRAMPRA